jgi:hypothetical protein
MDGFRGTRRKFVAWGNSLLAAGGLASPPLHAADSHKAAEGEDYCDKLGVTKIVNAAGTYTALTASTMPLAVRAAVARAAKHPVRLAELQKAAGEYIARLLHCEAALVTAGAASALTLGTAACVTMGKRPAVRSIPNDVTGLAPRSGPRAVALSIALVLLLTLTPAWMAAQQRGQRGGAGNPFPGGANPDGSLRPTPPVIRLFSQDAYTEYAILAPGTEQFRIRFWPEEPRAGATELVNATRGGSEGSDIEVYDPRTGKPLKFTYRQAGDDPENHAVHATLPLPVPEGGIGRVLIYKTYKDPRTYMMHGDDIVWVRSLSGYRLGVVLPKGFSFLSSDVAAQLTTTADGLLKLAFANPSGQSNPVTIHARPTTAKFTPVPYTDMFFDDIKTLYDLDAPETHAIRLEQTYSDFRKGDKAKLDSLAYLQLQDLKVIDLDTAKPLTPVKEGKGLAVRLEVPIVDERQSAHIRIAGTLKDAGYRTQNGDLVFDRTLHGLRNTVLLPAGWEVSGVSQSGTIGMYQGRAFVALIDLNAENNYRVTIHATRRTGDTSK